MLKIKLIVVGAACALFAFALFHSTPSTVSAETDVVSEIAQYKTWTRMNREPIRVELAPLDLAGGG